MINRKNIDNNLKPFKKTLFEIKKYNLSSLEDSQIAAMSQKLKDRAVNRNAADADA